MEEMERISNSQEKMQLHSLEEHLKEYKMFVTIFFFITLYALD